MARALSRGPACKDNRRQFLTHVFLASIALQAQTTDPYGLTRLLFTFVPLILIFYFLLIRPQRKLQQKHMEMINALKAGDEVITDGGIIGHIVHLTEDRATIRTAENTRIVVVRAKIARVVTPETAAQKKE